ncbi:hypothetical protein CPHO_12440 (plasmid) [Corynebacterium phocae]|uniref:Uncharacterized protein n=1 Tax=Corynebacterium phocae TaxID=161895 RepID=A0A1L7D6Q5_9CORY|nr:hypothetical protein [Corynebacterium phocae]APT93828.1 hypothetical protein CPHO_12440 [Corynebacterium phocae]KAA8719785.1 hypothetical protein F4V58_12350 [Corynebacterium phocae]
MPPKKKTNQIAATIRKPAKATDTPRTVRSTLTSPSDRELSRRTTIYLTPETWEGLKIAAAKHHTTLSMFMEQLSRDYLKTTKRT